MYEAKMEFTLYLHYQKLVIFFITKLNMQDQHKQNKNYFISLVKEKNNENFENNLKDLQFHNFLILIIENMKDKSKKR